MGSIELNGPGAIFLSVLIGDALGSTLDGMSEGHIRSCFRNIDGYIDPLPALKGKTHRWRKPGLYTSLSQTMLLLVLLDAAGENRGGTPGGMLRGYGAGSAPDVLRHPGPVERAAFGDEGRPFEGITARLPAIIGPLAVPGNRPPLAALEYLLSLGKALCRNPLTLAGALAWGMLLRDFSLSPGLQGKGNLLSRAGDTLAGLKKLAGENAPLLFQAGFNPDTLTEHIGTFESMLKSLPSIAPAEAERLICEGASRYSPSPLSRPTVDHPLCLIPFVIMILDRGTGDPSEAIFEMARRGGAAGTSCALAGGMLGALHGTDWIPGKLLDDLVNRKPVLQLIDSLSGKRRIDAGSALHDFLKKEGALTAKEREEFGARQKRSKTPKRKEAREGRDRELTGHVIESWTKWDKARWRRERKGNPGSDDDDTGDY